MLDGVARPCWRNWTPISSGFTNGWERLARFRRGLVRRDRPALGGGLFAPSTGLGLMISKEMGDDLYQMLERWISSVGAWLN